MISLDLSIILLPFVLAFSAAHAFDPYDYSRQLNNSNEALAAIESALNLLNSSSHPNTSSLVGTAVSSSVLIVSPTTSENGSVSVGTSQPVITGSISSDVSSLATAVTSGQDGSSTITSVISSQSIVPNLSSIISTTAHPADSTSSSITEGSISSSATNADSLSASSSRPALSTNSATIVASTASSDSDGSTTNAPSSTRTGAALVPSFIKATDGSDRSTTVTWSAVKTGSTSTTDSSGQPTVIPAPYYRCDSPLCINTGCVLAILCSSSGGAAGFEGFPPPSPPPAPPADTGDGDSDGDSPSASASQSEKSPTSSPSQSSGSTTASSLSSSSSGTCAPITTVADPGPTSVGDPDDGSRRRLRRTLHGRLLVAREAPVINTIGTCKLVNQVNIPLFSSFKQAMNLNRQRNGNGGANGRIYDAIAKWYSETLDTSGGPFYGSKKSLNPFNSLNIGSIDHVWEKSNVGDFLASLIGTEFDCDDLNSLFSSSKLQNIFDQLPSMDPSNVQPGFAAMNRNINGMKGWMFSQGLSSTIFRRIYNSDDKIIQGIERQAIIFDWFNSDPGIQSMHDKTNNRIYSAFLALDDHISTKKIQRAKGRGDLTQKFGPTFKNWYEQLLGKTGSETWAWASGEVTRMNADTSLRKCFRDAINIIRNFSNVTVGVSHYGNTYIDQTRYRYIYRNWDPFSDKYLSYLCTYNLVFAFVFVVVFNFAIVFAVVFALAIFSEMYCT